MKCIVTAGPTYEELDEVRRLTNFSTGSLGSALAGFLAGQGFDVELLIGHYSTCQMTSGNFRRQTFTTTDDLRSRLEALSSPDVGAVFHAAAVSDFTFGQIWERDSSGKLQEIHAAKIPSRATSLIAELRPTPKIIRHLRDWYPKAFIVGWKYELDGGRDQVIAKGRQQMDDCKTDACVVNGRGYGEGFGLLTRAGADAHLTDRDSLFPALAAGVNGRKTN